MAQSYSSGRTHSNWRSVPAEIHTCQLCARLLGTAFDPRRAAKWPCLAPNLQFRSKMHFQLQAAATGAPARSASPGSRRRRTSRNPEAPLRQAPELPRQSPAPNVDVEPLPSTLPNLSQLENLVPSISIDDILAGKPLPANAFDEPGPSPAESQAPEAPPASQPPSRTRPGAPVLQRRALRPWEKAPPPPPPPPPAASPGATSGNEKSTSGPSPSPKPSQTPDVMTPSVAAADVQCQLPASTTQRLTPATDGPLAGRSSTAGAAATGSPTQAAGQLATNLTAAQPSSPTTTTTTGAMQPTLPEPKRSNNTSSAPPPGTSPPPLLPRPARGRPPIAPQTTPEHDPAHAVQEPTAVPRTPSVAPAGGEGQPHLTSAVGLALDWPSSQPLKRSPSGAQWGPGEVSDSQSARPREGVRMQGPQGGSSPQAPYSSSPASTWLPATSGTDGRHVMARDNGSSPAVRGRWEPLSAAVEDVAAQQLPPPSSLTTFVAPGPADTGCPAGVGFIGDLPGLGLGLQLESQSTPAPLVVLRQQHQNPQQQQQGLQPEVVQSTRAPRSQRVRSMEWVAARRAVEAPPSPPAAGATTASAAAAAAKAEGVTGIGMPGPWSEPQGTLVLPEAPLRRAIEAAAADQRLGGGHIAATDPEAAAVLAAAAITSPEQLPPTVDRLTWRLHAAVLFPELYDAEWHSGLFDFLFELWLEVGRATVTAGGAASQRRLLYSSEAELAELVSMETGEMDDESMPLAAAAAPPPPSPSRQHRAAELIDAAYTFANVCFVSEDFAVRSALVVSVLDCLDDHEVLLEQMMDRLPRRLMMRLVVPLVARFQPPWVVEEVLAAVADRYPDAGAPASSAPRVWEELVARLMAVQAAHPAAGLGVLHSVLDFDPPAAQDEPPPAPHPRTSRNRNRRTAGSRAPSERPVRAAPTGDDDAGGGEGGGGGWAGV